MLVQLGCNSGTQEQYAGVQFRGQARGFVAGLSLAGSTRKPARRPGGGPSSSGLRPVAFRCIPSWRRPCLPCTAISQPPRARLVGNPKIPHAALGSPSRATPSEPGATREASTSSRTCLSACVFDCACLRAFRSSFSAALAAALAAAAAAFARRCSSLCFSCARPEGSRTGGTNRSPARAMGPAGWSPHGALPHLSRHVQHQQGSDRCPRIGWYCRHESSIAGRTFRALSASISSLVRLGRRCFLACCPAGLSPGRHSSSSKAAREARCCDSNGKQPSAPGEVRLPRRGPLEGAAGGVALDGCCCCCSCRCSCWWYCALGGESCSSSPARCLPGRPPADWLCTANSGVRAPLFGCAACGAAAVAAVTAAAVAAAEVEPARRCCSRAVRLASGGRSASLSLSPLQRSTTSDAGIANDACGAMGSHSFNAEGREKACTL